MNPNAPTRILPEIDEIHCEFDFDRQHAAGRFVLERFKPLAQVDVRNAGPDAQCLVEIANPEEGGDTIEALGVSLISDEALSTGDPQGSSRISIPASQALSLVVDAGKVAAALEDALQQEDAAGELRFSLEIRRKVSGPARSRRVEVSIRGMRQPRPARAVTQMREIAMDHEREGARIPCGLISVELPLDLAFYNDREMLGSSDHTGAAGFEMVLRSLENDVVLPLAARMADSGGGQVSLEQVDIGNGSSSQVIYRGAIANPRQWRHSEKVEIELCALSGIIERELQSEDHAPQMFEKKYGFSIELRWSHGLAQPWETGGPHELCVSVDGRKSFSVSTGGAYRKALAGQEEELVLEPVAIDLPSHFPADRSGQVFFLPDDLLVLLETNIELGAGTSVSVRLPTGDGDFLVDAEPEWLPARSANGTSLPRSHLRVSLIDCGLEDALRDRLQWLKGLGDSHRLELRLAVRQKGADKALARFMIPVHFRFAEVRWPICIDLGMSATSVWVQTPRRADDDDGDIRVGYEAVPLGSYHAELDPGHDEAHASSGRTAGSGDGRLYLIPSHVGLDSSRASRGRYLPQSNGNLSLAVEGSEAVRARLQRMDRSFDVSVPFPSSRVLAQQDVAVIFDLKKAIMANQGFISLGRRRVLSRTASGDFKQTDRIRTGDLLSDYLDEILRLYVARYVSEELKYDADDAGYLEVVANPQLILTHPAGIGMDTTRLYQRAARRVIRRFLGNQDSRIEALDAAGLTSNLDSGAGEAMAGEPVLIPESVASARFVLDRVRWEKRLGNLFPSGRGILVSLDVGAGTFDISLMRVHTNGEMISRYETLSSFGLSCAGDRLDEVIAGKVISIARDAFRDPVAARYGRLAASLQRAPESAGFRKQISRDEYLLRRQIRAAKAVLAERCRHRLDQGDSFDWQEQDGPLEVVLHQQGKITGLIDPDNALAGQADALTSRIGIEDGEVELAFEPMDGDEEHDGANPAGGYRIVLRIGPELFRDLPPEDESKAVCHEEMLQLLGEVMPSIAMDEAARLSEGDPVVVSVTGRTTLWPPLYKRIMDAVASHSSGARPAIPYPLQPGEMKRAVVEGAGCIISENGEKRLQPLHANPVAVAEIEDKPMQDGSGSRFELVEWARKVHYLQADDAGEGATVHEIEIELSGKKRLLVRALPALNAHRLDVIRRAGGGARPYVELRGAGKSILHSGQPGLRSARIRLITGGRDYTEIIVRLQGMPDRHLVLDGDLLQQAPGQGVRQPVEEGA